jgi:hypothetical protein
MVTAGCAGGCSSRLVRCRAAHAILIAVSLISASSCAGVEKVPMEGAVRPTYDKETGKLTQLTYDANKDGRIDTWTDMDGTKPLQSRIDQNGDGKIDRWEQFDRSGALAKIGFSRKDDGKADVWAFPEGGGSVRRIEISSTGDEHHIDRWEYYDPPRSGGDGHEDLVRAEEDENGDGRPDKWETYRDGAVETVAFDEDGDGSPDRRLTYRGSALFSIESHPDASGRFTRRIEVTRQVAPPSGGKSPSAASGT